ncbi:Putative isopenicillin N synthase-like superfamily [Septoria linicola]|uniref:Isopenicillin N synthase-like superfamily n=1 Tax=Septoria linicola TaxID=215465 RepID=A0A9Q9AVD1_9PEZI|nr:putative isopenicillin N synthase-like superfamily [Septoria linicola]USW52662.1 Putative isopenicillin N synthase-like superfamily [Septoria linicola]
MGSIPESRPPAISVSLQELKDGSVSLETLEQAFGPESLGIIVVRDLPGDFVGMRRKVLSYASYLANLPREELAKVEIPEARYNVGWSCGKEKLDNGQFDTFKGSYYVQPIHSADGKPEAKARELFPHIPDMTSPNVWPSEDILPGFEDIFEKLCRLMVDVAGLVARSCDRYGAAKLEGYQQGTLENIVRGSVSTKARLLHYFPPPAKAPGAEEKGDDDWCGTHSDLGALTGLTSNMFIDESAYSLNAGDAKRDEDGLLSDLPELERHPDPKAGLWIKDRAGRTTQVNIPRDCLAFQTGEALQLITRGKFRAVPHFVRGPAGVVGEDGKEKQIARNTLAVFTQPNLWEIADENEKLNFAGLAKRVFEKTY